jgi:hypothetical protein
VRSPPPGAPGHTTAWTLLHAATSPGVQERVAEELDAIGLLSKPGAPPPREMEYEDLKRMPYLTAVAKEAMRMLPVVGGAGRGWAGRGGAGRGGAGRGGVGGRRARAAPWAGRQAWEARG